MDLSTNEITIKWNHFGVLRRFEINDSDWKFASLMTKIRQIDPLFSHQLCYSGKYINFQSE